MGELVVGNSLPSNSNRTRLGLAVPGFDPLLDLRNALRRIACPSLVSECIEASSVFLLRGLGRFGEREDEESKEEAVDTVGKAVSSDWLRAVGTGFGSVVVMMGIRVREFARRSLRSVESSRGR